MTTVTQLLYIVTGLSVALTGLGLIVAFGVLAFIGMPLFVVGLGLLSAGVDG